MENSGYNWTYEERELRSSLEGLVVLKLGDDYGVFNFRKVRGNKDLFTLINPGDLIEFQIKVYEEVCKGNLEGSHESPHNYTTVNFNTLGVFEKNGLIVLAGVGSSYLERNSDLERFTARFYAVDEDGIVKTLSIDLFDIFEMILEHSVTRNVSWGESYKDFTKEGKMTMNFRFTLGEGWNQDEFSCDVVFHTDFSVEKYCKLGDRVKDLVKFF